MYISTMEGSAADRAGLTTGDSIVGVNGMATRFSVTCGRSSTTIATTGYARLLPERNITNRNYRGGFSRNFRFLCNGIGKVYQTVTIEYGFFEYIPGRGQIGYTDIEGLRGTVQICVHQSGCFFFRRIRSDRKPLPCTVELAGILDDDRLPVGDPCLYEYTAYSGTRRRPCDVPYL